MHCKSILPLGACLVLGACAPTKVELELNMSGCPEFYSLSSVEARVLRRLGGGLCVAASSSGLPGATDQVLELPSEGGEVWVLLLGYRKSGTSGCGDGLCEPKLGESCSTCLRDCGKCDCPGCEVGGCVGCQGLARVLLTSETVFVPLSRTDNCTIDAISLQAAGLPEGAFVLSSPPCP